MATHRLIVLRHAKSDWGADARTDHERPLNERGRVEAPIVAARLHDRGWVPERVIASDATRTRETWALMAPVFEKMNANPALIETTHELYLAGVESLRAWVPRHDARVALVLGHNPGWEMAVAALSGRTVTMKTANAALLEAEGDDWHSVLNRKMRFVDLIDPK
jgi:phosphohistidine phosphatase